ncbi:MAG: MazG nucleotide pyrophosphohydrolase domain-containing protein, partial [Bacteroidales bacterium]|nr:MazG nucleotide pyrophosphohydrolase domain-containing protein [Bacteroidales bacterium]
MAQLTEETEELSELVDEQFEYVENGSKEKQWAYVLAAALMDVAQSVISFIYILEDKYGIDLDEVKYEHILKMV